MIGLAGDPALVRRAAGMLTARGDALESHADSVGAAARDLSAAWAGAASLAFDGAAVAAGRGASTAARELRVLADASRRYADRLEAAQGALARLEVREAQARDEAGRLRAAAEVGAGATTGGLRDMAPAGADPGVSLGAGAAGALALAARSQAAEALAAARAAETVRGEQLGAARDLVRALDDSDPASALPAVVGTLGDVWLSGDARLFADVARDAAGVASKALATASLWGSAVTLGRIQRVSGGAPLLAGGRAAAAAAAARARAGAALQRLHGGSFQPGALGVARTAAKRVGLGATLVEGLSDVRRGAPDHGGARSVATRVAGAAGAAGAGVLLAQGAGLAVAGGPVTLALAGTAVTAYGAWKLGTTVYDHRVAIRRAATVALGRGRDAVRAGARLAARESSRLAGRAVRGIGQVGSSIEAGARQAQRATRAVGERLEGARRLVGGPWARAA